MSSSKWVDIVVDDRLPCIENAYDLGFVIPAFTKVTEKLKSKIAEFWPALIEKAYAKYVPFIFAN